MLIKNVTVIIPVKNDFENLKLCLDRLDSFENVVVLDSQSSDGTAEYCGSKGVRVLQFEWNGKYPKKRNWYLLNHKIETDWVLFLDSDEYLTDEFIDELSTKITKTQHVGFWLNYTTYYRNQKLRFGVPQRKLALFRPTAGVYERIEENAWSKFDMEIHEHPVLAGSTGSFKSSIEHNDYKRINHFVTKHTEYASWEARRYHDLQKDKERNYLSTRQKMKYQLIKTSIIPIIYFLYSYVIRLGIFDGRAGLSYSIMKSWYFYLILLNIKEMTNDK